MAPPRRKQRGPHEGREYKLRIPEDIAKRIEAKAKKEQRPQNRIVINELALIPHFEQLAELRDQVQDMKIVLARYSKRIILGELSEEMLTVVDDVLQSEGGKREAFIDKLRVLRNAMLKTPKEK